LANYHEQVLFTDPDLDGIGNIAAQTIIPPIIDALQDIASDTKPLKLQYIGISYKPVSLKPAMARFPPWPNPYPALSIVLTWDLRPAQFLSLFNMTQAGIDGFVSYASALALEVRNGTNGMTVSMNL